MCSAVFRRRFEEIHERHSPPTRPFFVHETSVIDAKATRNIIHGVRHGILTSTLRDVNLI